MFLCSGASSHGHEYSPPQPQPTRFPASPSALPPNSHIGSVARQSPPFLSPASPAASVPTRPPSVSDPIRPSSFSKRRRTTSDVARRTVGFREPQTGPVQAPVPSEDEESLVGSELSDQTDTSSRLKRRRKRAPRRSTRFALAYPAPQLRTKQRTFLQFRPRVLLQLQELGDKRAIPAFDIVPSSLIAGTLIIPMLAKRFPRMFRAKPHLGQNDLLLVRSEDYSPPQAHDDRAESGLDHRDMLAVISTTADDDCVEIVFQDGSIWVSSPMTNGSYEFAHVDDHGQTVKARWVKRSLVSPVASWTSANTTSTPTPIPTSPPPPEQKWTFSIMDPTTRRHPIQGMLTSTALDIFDTYSSIATLSSRYPPTRPFGSDISSIVEETPLSNNSTEERSTMVVTKEHKTLMLATAIWVSLRQRGWPASATPKLPRVMSQCRSVGSVSSGSSQMLAIGNGGSGTASPPVSLLQSRSISEDTLAAHHPGKRILKRAVSSGSEFMKRRREAADTMEIEENEKRDAGRRLGETHTCRLSVWRLTQKLFHLPRTPRVSS